jgi:hypothetical protein
MRYVEFHLTSISRPNFLGRTFTAMQYLLNAAMRWLEEFIQEIAVLNDSRCDLITFKADLTIRLIMWQAQR